MRGALFTRKTHQTLATPTMALSKSSSVWMPSVSYSMAWLAPWLLGFVIVRLYRFMTGLSAHGAAEVAKALRGARLRRVRAGRRDEDGMTA